ncbi:hypothetical protein BU24DRAFT_466727 [Aaosphaeria arxii CBS 175.79]|uniref:Uncharacterized protein n=1 Tax=Aaosphaeria arxii CBS 175.79 TaxID=1450172 RepID=A0A6A5XDA3_9PLEO|nr:uncharacterized protein BU24DRAFT_466727 [Aaosphaeria arxii CBS 175.79]KAF2010982.1 hypothetical protein BU24DRAFT_466727 [Aaosphaeria arxii CBS 175.79]
MSFVLVCNEAEDDAVSFWEAPSCGMSFQTDKGEPMTLSRSKLLAACPSLEVSEVANFQQTPHVAQQFSKNWKDGAFDQPPNLPTHESKPPSSKSRCTASQNPLHSIVNPQKDPKATPFNPPNLPIEARVDRFTHSEPGNDSLQTSINHNMSRPRGYLVALRHDHEGTLKLCISTGDGSESKTLKPDHSCIWVMMDAAANTITTEEGAATPFMVHELGWFTNPTLLKSICLATPVPLHQAGHVSTFHAWVAMLLHNLQVHHSSRWAPNLGNIM